MAKVLCADISGMDKTLYETLYAAADPERRQRADRYSKREDALRCIVSGALLSYAVKRELGLEAFTVEKGENGKPSLLGVEGFCYNLSHSGKWVVLACSESEVGVDVEKMREEANREMISNRFFAPEEQSWIGASENTVERFFRVWTGKESYLKYLGTGLQKALNSFSVLDAGVARKLHSRELEGGYSLTLCTNDETNTFELLEAETLI